MSAKIGDYVILNTLGVGTFGVVKLAEHQPTGLQVAVKIINKQRMNQMNMTEKLSREVNILRLMSHPHVIRVFELLDTPTEIFMVCEYVPGGELFDYIVHKVRLREAEARRIFQQIISAVEYCHLHFCAHRDIKPENILLTTGSSAGSSGEVSIKLADLGLSNKMRDGEFLKTSCGSPNYAAPEIVSGRFYSGPEIDVWSCGVVLYALLAGSLPFDDENVQNLFRKIKHGNFTLPGHITPDAKDLIVQMLVVDPSKRLTIPMIRKHKWFKVGLPDYLKVAPVPQLTPVGSVIALSAGPSTIAMETAILHEMRARGYAVSDGVPGPRGNADGLNGREKVAYDLLMHSKERELQMRASEEAAHAGELGLYDKNTLDQILTRNRLFLVADPAPLDLKDLRLAASSSSTPREAGALPVVGSHWHVGVEATAPSVTVSRELQVTMRSLDLIWFGISPWKLRVRPKAHAVYSDTVNVEDAFQLTVNVYKVQTQRYVIDVSLHSGDFAAALLGAERLIKALTTNPKLGTPLSPPSALFTTS
jgi:hypothetical protein